eukprot:scaffold3595_cov235-Ochromonas_danica.AAC.25
MQRLRDLCLRGGVVNRRHVSWPVGSRPLLLLLQGQCEQPHILIPIYCSHAVIRNNPASMSSEVGCSVCLARGRASSIQHSDRVDLSRSKPLQVGVSNKKALTNEVFDRSHELFPPGRPGSQITKLGLVISQPKRDQSLSTELAETSKEFACSGIVELVGAVAQPEHREAQAVETRRGETLPQQRGPEGFHGRGHFSITTCGYDEDDELVLRQCVEGEVADVCHDRT